MAVPTRVYFSNHQFLDEDDFRDEQAYHMGMRERHGKASHTPGVVTGLVVKRGSGNLLDVTAGTAIDRDGRQVVFDGDSVAYGNDATQYVTLECDPKETRAKTWGGLTLATRTEERTVLRCGPDQPSGKQVLLAVVTRSGTTVTVNHAPRAESGPRGPLTIDPPPGADAGGITLSRSGPGVAQLTGGLQLTRTGGLGGDLTADGGLSAGANVAASGSLSAGAGLTVTGAVRLTGGTLTAGTSNPVSTARATIEDAAVPLALRETGQAVNAGGLWRLRLDGGLLSFDANTAATETFASMLTPLSLSGARVGIGGVAPTSTLHVLAPAAQAPVTGLTVDVPGWAGNPTAGHLLRLNDTSAGTTPLIVRGDGNVGIGTPAPGGRLDIRAQAAADEPVQTVMAYASGTGAGFKRALFGRASSGGQPIGVAAEGEALGAQMAYGLQAQAYGAGTGPRTAVWAYATGAGAAQATGGTFTATAPADGQAAGATLTVSGEGKGTRSALQAYAYGNASSTAWAYGVRASAMSGGDGGAFGLVVDAYGDGKASNVGAQIGANGGANNATAGGANIYATTNGDTNSATGLTVSANGTGKAQKTGINCSAGGGAGGRAQGIVVWAEGAGDQPAYGVQGTAYGAGKGQRIGVAGNANAGAAGATCFGGQFSASPSGDNTAYAVYANASSLATPASAASKYGIFATASGAGTNYAGYFSGNVWITGALTVQGTVTKGGGSFLIDHPLEPMERTLRHNFVEAPEDLCLYRGRVALDKEGRATVELPSYFTALTDEAGATAYVTALGEEPFPVSHAFHDDGSGLTVYGAPGGEVAWLVAADRDDPVSESLRRPVEEEKGGDNGEKGKLLHPLALGEPEELGVHFETVQAAAPAEPAPAPEPPVVEMAATEPMPEPPPPPEPTPIPDEEQTQ